MTKAILFLVMLGASTGLLGCSSDDEPPLNPIPEQGELEILGTWMSNFDSLETIDAESWTVESSFGTSVSRIESFLNSANEIITQNPDDAEFNPSLYSRTLWTDIEGDSFYYCTTDFGLASAADAETRNTTADASDPENSGCGQGEMSFSWTKLTRQ